MPSRTDVSAHLTHALTGHRSWCRTNGIAFPPVLDLVLAALADSSGQHGPNLALSLAATDDPPVALDYEAAAKRLSVSARTVRRMASDGRLAVVRVGSRVLVPVASIEDFLESQRDHQRVAN